MMSVRGILEGHQLYTDVFTCYGPVYYFYEYLIHGLLGVPLTHDAVRWICIVQWLSSASLLALAARVATRSSVLALFVFAQAALHLTQLADEPGHPQALVCILLAVAVLASVRSTGRRMQFSLLAVIAAGLVLIKINVGIFFGFALLLTSGTQSPWFRSRPFGFFGLLFVSASMPFLLMRPNIGEAWAALYSAQASASILAAGVVGIAFRDGQCTLKPSQFAQAAAAFAGCVVTCLALTLLFTGTSLASVLESLVTGPAKVGGVFCAPLSAPFILWSGVSSLVSASLVAILRYRRIPISRTMIFAKLTFGLLGTFILVGDVKAQLAYLLPWSWVVLVPGVSKRMVFQAGNFSRTFLCLLTVWQGLQAYPVAGTQVAIGTFLLVLTCSFCLWDALNDLCGLLRPRLTFDASWFSAWKMEVAQMLACAGILILFASWWCPPLASWRHYKSLSPLGLKGAERIRLPSSQVTTYRALTQLLEANSGTFLAIPGFNSLYFWSGKNPPTYFSIPEVVAVGREREKGIALSLLRSRNSLLVLNLAGPNVGGATFSTGTGALRSLVQTRGRVIKEVGDFRLLEIVESSEDSL